MMKIWGFLFASYFTVVVVYILTLIQNSRLSYIFLRAKFQAARPVDAPHVCGGHLDDVQLEGLLDEDEVVVRHAEAVVVAGREQRAARNRANHFHLLQSRDIFCRV